MYRKANKVWTKHLDFMILDLCCLQVAFLIAFMMRNGIQSPYQSPLYRNMNLVLTLIHIGTMILFEPMKNVLKRGRYKEFTITVKQVLLVILTATFYLFYVQDAHEYSRLALFYMAIIYGVLSYLVRIFWKHRLRERLEGAGSCSLLIITVKEMLDTVESDIKNYDYEKFHIAGLAVLDYDLRGRMYAGILVVADAKNLIDYVRREWIDEVFINLPEGASYPQELIHKFTEMGVVVHTVLMKNADVADGKRLVERMGNYTVLTTSLNYATGSQLFIKRMLDIAGGIVGCVITAILFVILAPIIYIHSPGPVFFSQTRVGKNGKKFRLYKFRSMYMNAEEQKKELMETNRIKDGMMFKLDYDPRIIGSKKLKDGTIKRGIGNIIREWSLDEFPQFYNVLKGDMSLVGTRPPTVDEWEKYDLHHRARLAVKPGITGMWQVSGRSNITDFEDVVRLDKKYIEEWSQALDIKILLKTFLVVFGKDGAM